MCLFLLLCVILVISLCLTVENMPKNDIEIMELLHIKEKSNFVFAFMCNDFVFAN